MTTEYSGQREVYPLSSASYYTVTIPVNTPDIVITCEISRGYIYSRSTGFSSTTTNPSVTFTLTNTSGSGEIACVRDISGVSFAVLTLYIVAGGELYRDTSLSNPRFAVVDSHGSLQVFSILSVFHVLHSS